MLPTSGHDDRIQRLRDHYDNNDTAGVEITDRLMQHDHIRQVFCYCDRFKLWYVGGNHGTRWCECGHADDEHLDNRGTCCGESDVHTATVERGPEQP